MLKECRQHLDQVEEDYPRHLVEALRISGALAVASLACAAHAFVPALFQSTASRRIARLHDEIARRHRG